jgi:hypothetical protein
VIDPLMSELRAFLEKRKPVYIRANNNDPQRTEFRETQYEWEYGRGADQTGLAMKFALSPLVIPGSLASLAPRNDDSSFCHHQPE